MRYVLTIFGGYFLAALALSAIGLHTVGLAGVCFGNVLALLGVYAVMASVCPTIPPRKYRWQDGDKKMTYQEVLRVEAWHRRRNSMLEAKAQLREFCTRLGIGPAPRW